MKKVIINLCLIATLFITANASAMTVSYDIGQKRIGNWSGSFVHKASGCSGSSDLNMDGSGGNDTLYMCGDKTRVTGKLTGEWDGNVLSNISGNIGQRTITGGSLGGDYYRSIGNSLRPMWNLDIEGLGRFFFEDMPINQISANSLTLWGQNRSTYGCLEGCGQKWGIDLYGAGSTSLPEPGTLGLFLFGLLAAPMLLARKKDSLVKIK